MSLKKQLIIYLKNRREYISKAEIEQFGESLGFLGDNVARRCRELQNEGVFERKKQGKSIAYKYCGPAVETKSIQPLLIKKTNPYL